MQEKFDQGGFSRGNGDYYQSQLDQAFILGTVRAENNAIRDDIRELRDMVQNLVDRIDTLTEKQAELTGSHSSRRRWWTGAVTVLAGGIGAAASALIGLHH